MLHSGDKVSTADTRLIWAVCVTLLMADRLSVPKHSSGCRGSQLRDTMAFLERAVDRSRKAPRRFPVFYAVFQKIRGALQNLLILQFVVSPPTPAEHFLPMNLFRFFCRFVFNFKPVDDHRTDVPGGDWVSQLMSHVHHEQTLHQVQPKQSSRRPTETTVKNVETVANDVDMETVANDVNMETVAAEAPFGHCSSSHEPEMKGDKETPEGTGFEDDPSRFFVSAAGILQPFRITKDGSVEFPQPANGTVSDWTRVYGADEEKLKKLALEINGDEDVLGQFLGFVAKPQKDKQKKSEPHKPKKLKKIQGATDIYLCYKGGPNEGDSCQVRLDVRKFPGFHVIKNKVAQSRESGFQYRREKRTDEARDNSVQSKSEGRRNQQECGKEKKEEKKDQKKDQKPSNLVSQVTLLAARGCSVPQSNQTDQNADRRVVREDYAPKNSLENCYLSNSAAKESKKRDPDKTTRAQRKGNKTEMMMRMSGEEFVAKGLPRWTPEEAESRTAHVHLRSQPNRSRHSSRAQPACVLRGGCLQWSPSEVGFSAGRAALPHRFAQRSASSSQQHPRLVPPVKDEKDEKDEKGDEKGDEKEDSVPLDLPPDLPPSNPPSNPPSPLGPPPPYSPSTSPSSLYLPPPVVVSPGQQSSQARFACCQDKDSTCSNPLHCDPSL